ncbi:phosphopantetheine-binding protein [Bacillus toyonensis]|uniref:Acyl carrier protein n=1 Tax=Bacillus toyonensis TaxID=155322 RepID=A0AB73SCH7_9BACI|nr:MULTISPECIES: phosphopantetheine-binding protein [Bacillus cereus group]OTX04697.1 hypothetical protein BK712_19010 [Bacillus thuringiensis serovar seoulensis]MBH0358286.1 acyl carrier protein [Bacillus toyonensis biovar Thuringiensis]MED3201893.1 phosphopantetheine-binding protein [Bacillus toyonensis]NKW97325.1 acyl carrier protein [Bacillus toyonensis]PEI86524.1 acyl carrier protein [Bacillus toyonensis]
MNKLNNLMDVVTEILALQLELAVADVKVDANIFEELGLDSTGIIELLLALEEKCEIEFDMEELDPSYLESVTTISNYIMELKNS